MSRTARILFGFALSLLSERTGSIPRRKENHTMPNFKTILAAVLCAAVLTVPVCAA